MLDANGKTVPEPAPTPGFTPQAVPQINPQPGSSNNPAPSSPLPFPAGVVSPAPAKAAAAPATNKELASLKVVETWLEAHVPHAVKNMQTVHMMTYLKGKASELLNRLEAL